MKKWKWTDLKGPPPVSEYRHGKALAALVEATLGGWTLTVYSPSMAVVHESFKIGRHDAVELATYRARAEWLEQKWAVPR